MRAARNPTPGTLPDTTSRRKRTRRIGYGPIIRATVTRHPTQGEPPVPPTPDLLTLPVLALRLGTTPDALRRAIRTDARLARQIRRAGTARFVEPKNLRRVCDLLKLPGAGVPSAPVA